MRLASSRRNEQARPAPEQSNPLERLSVLAESRIAIEAISAEIDGGRFPAKATVGRPFIVEADIFGDGHDRLGAALSFRRDASDAWQEAPMALVDNDRWRGEIVLPEIGLWQVGIIAWRDLFATWHVDTSKKLAAGQHVSLETIEGRELVVTAAAKSSAPELSKLAEPLAALSAEEDVLALLLDKSTLEVMQRQGIRSNATRYADPITVWVDRTAAAFSAWYELMPRSQTDDPERHGTFDDVIARLPYVRDLGFDVLYFPPIHPIGKTNRKGRNNTLTPAPDDPGSPYAIGSAEGGHDAIHPELGTLDDFDRLVSAAAEHGLEIALDFAIQCSPDHPWIKQHPEWFDWRPDGTIKFAENPPKKYEDIVNVHFYREAIPGLWIALRDVVLFWVDHGVKIFRVDNPHTKPFPFWEWMIGEIRNRHPDVIFLAEAFTRPKVMERLAKVGFTQSYSYFTWRNTKVELETYLTELTQGPAREVHAAELLRQHAGHQPALPAAERSPGLSHAARARRDAGRQLRHLQRLRDLRGAGRSRQGRVSRFREVPDPRLGHGRARQHPGRHRAGQPPAPRASGAAGLRVADLLQRLRTTTFSTTARAMRQASSFLLFHVNLDPHNAHEFEFRGAALGVRSGGRCLDRGRGPAARQPLHLARQDPPHDARPA